MATGPVILEFGPFGFGEGRLERCISANGAWMCSGLVSSVFDIVLDGRVLRTNPSLGSSHAPHILRGGQHGAHIQFEQLFPINSVLRGDNPDQARLEIKVGDVRSKWADAGVYSLTANQEVWGERPVPGRQTAGSRNGNARYPTQFWRSVETIIRELMMRLNRAPQSIHLDGTHGYLDLRSIQIKSKQDGSSTTILDDCPPIDWKEEPAQSCLQDILDRYQLDLRLAPSAAIGFMLREQPSHSLGQILADIRSRGGEVVDITHDTNADAEPDSMQWIGEPIVVEDTLRVEPVMEDPHRPGHWVSMLRGESLAMVGINLPGAGFLAPAPTGRPGVSDAGLPVLRLWHELAMQSPPFAEIEDDALRARALAAFRFGRIMQPREEVPDPDTGTVQVLDVAPEGSTFQQEFRVPMATRLKITNQPGSLDPTGGGQVGYTPSAEIESAEPWRIMPMIPKRHMVRDDGTFELVPHRILVKNAVNPRGLSTKSMGSASSTFRDVGPVVENPTSDETHDGAEEWPCAPTIVDEFEGIIDFGRPIYGHDGRKLGDRSRLTDRLDWSVKKGITPDVREVVDCWGLPLIWWQGMFELRAFNNPLYDATTAHSISSNELWRDPGRDAFYNLRTLPQIAVTPRTPDKGFNVVRAEKIAGLQLHGVTGRLDGAGGGTVSFKPDGGLLSGDLGGTFTFHDIGVPGSGLSAGQPGYLTVPSQLHADEILTAFQSAQDAVYEQLESFRSTDDAVRGASAVLDGWVPDAVPGSSSSWPLERATFRCAGNGVAVTSLLVNGRGPRLEFGDPEAARRLMRGSIAGSTTLRGGVVATSAEKGFGRGGGGGGTPVTAADPTPPEPSMGARTLCVADGRAQGYLDATGGPVHEQLGEVGIVDLPGGRRIWKAERHSHWARAWVPLDTSELLLDEVELEDGSKHYAMLEGLKHVVSGVDGYHSDTARTQGTNCKDSVQMPIRNVKLLKKDAGEPTETMLQHADRARKLYLFFDHQTLSAGDEASGGELRQRDEEAADMAEAASGRRHTLSLDETIPFRYEPEPEEPTEEEEEPEEGEEEEEEPSGVGIPVDRGMNWAFLSLEDNEDEEQAAAGNRYYVLGTKRRNKSDMSAADALMTVEHVEEWNLLTVAGTTAGDCSNYCDIASLTGDTAGFTEDFDDYSRQTSVAAIVDHLEEIYSQLQNGPAAALMAWSYADVTIRLLAELACCICQASIDMGTFSQTLVDCVCEGEEESLIARIAAAVCGTDCHGAANPLPECNF